MGKKDIFDLFRDNEHRLHEAPSPQNWGRLEKRLEARRAAQVRQRYVYFRQPLGMVAGLALVMGLAVVFLWLANSSSPNTQVAILGHPVNLEELDNAAPSTSADWEVAGLVVERPASLEQSIAEGSRPQQTLMVKNGPRPVSAPSMPTDSADNRSNEIGR